MTLQQLLKTAVQQNASDLHLVVGSPPVLRINGQIVRVKADVLGPDNCRNLCYSILTDYQKSKFEQIRELDLSFDLKDVARFRANFSVQKGFVSAAFRQIPLEIPKFETLGLPESLLDLTNFRNGLVLVTGPTGSGKSTTLAALVDKLNSSRTGHIVTMEDPIEFVHQHKSCIVNQREVGADTESFRAALKHILRQDPDYILLGEMRDLETIEAALVIAETGHLVFASLHTNSAVDTVNRVVNVFPGESQERIRVILSFVLRGVVSQRLVPTVSGKQQVAAEVMITNSAIAHLIREGKMHQIYGMMQVGQDRSGNMTMNQCLAKLAIRRKVEMKVAFEYSNDPEELDSLLKKAGV